MQSSGFNHTETSDYAKFSLKDAWCGVALDNIQEVNKIADLTVVPQAPDYVMGIINLRGRIITVIDTGKWLGLAPIRTGENTRTIILSDGDEAFGMMVDGIGNVVTVDPTSVDAPPANIGGIAGRFFHGVFKSENKLIGLLAMDALL